MNQYLIYNRDSGHVLGAWHVESPEAALAALWADSCAAESMPGIVQQSVDRWRAGDLVIEVHPGTST